MLLQPADDPAPRVVDGEITLSPDGTGTILRLRHVGLPNDIERRSHLGGWELYTGKLATLLNSP